MLITVHRSRRLITSLCASLLLVVPYFVSNAQESSVGEVSPQTEVQTAQNQDFQYVKEGVPGGDSVVGDFVVGPGKIDIELRPGESKVVELMVTNRTGILRTFNLTTEDTAGSTDLNKPIILLGNERGPYSLRDYLSVPDTHFELAHNERARIPVTISIPPDAEPGGLYGTMLVDTLAIEPDSGETTQTVPQSPIIARIGTLFFVTVPGDVLHDAKLVEFGTIGKQKFFGSGPIKLGILHENTGSIHIAPYGEVRIVNMLGEEVGLVDLEPWFILPQSERFREITWTREFLFGRYTATAEISRGYDDIVDILPFTFWVLPWKLVTAGFGVVFITIFLIRTFFRKFEFKRKP